MNKPVWRMNSGSGVPSDYDGVAYTPKSTCEKIDSYVGNCFLDNLWVLDGHNEDIVAYQTTRTRKAKYERVECGYCEGVGVLFHKEESNNNLKCYCCNGKGYRLERVE